MGPYQCKPSADAILAQASLEQSGTAETARYEGVPKRRYLTLIQGNSSVEIESISVHVLRIQAVIVQLF